MFYYQMLSFEKLAKIVKIAFLIFICAIGVTNLVLAAMFLSWLAIALILTSLVLFGLIYWLAKVLYEALFCSSEVKLKNIRKILDHDDSLSEDSLLRILDLNHYDLSLLNKSRLFSGTSLVKRLGSYKQVLNRGIAATQAQLAEASGKLNKNVSYESEMEIRSISDLEWFEYLSTKLNYENELLSRLVFKEKQIIRECMLVDKHLDFEGLLGLQKRHIESCSICLAEFEAPHDVIILHCKHYFHRPCIEDWMAEKQSCPLCKSEV